jgi:hypothetical protein
MTVAIGSQQGAEGRIASDFVGMVHFEYLILRLPWVSGLRSRLVGGPRQPSVSSVTGNFAGSSLPSSRTYRNPPCFFFSNTRKLSKNSRSVSISGFSARCPCSCTRGGGGCPGRYRGPQPRRLPHGDRRARATRAASDGGGKYYRPVRSFEL